MSRVKCYCGNPLLPPKAVATGSAKTITYTGDAWSSFSITNISVIQQSTTIIKCVRADRHQPGQLFN